MAGDEGQTNGIHKIIESQRIRNKNKNWICEWNYTICFHHFIFENEDYTTIYYDIMFWSTECIIIMLYYNTLVYRIKVIR